MWVTGGEFDWERQALSAEIGRLDECETWLEEFQRGGKYAEGGFVVRGSVEGSGELRHRSCILFVLCTEVHFYHYLLCEVLSACKDSTSHDQY